MNQYDQTSEGDFLQDRLIGTTRHRPDINGKRVIMNPTVGEYSMAIGYSDYGYGQIGGNLDKLKEPQRGCKINNRMHDLHYFCVCYVGLGNEDAKVTEEGADHDGYYERLVYLPICTKIATHLSHVVNNTSADITFSLGEDSAPDDADALKYYADELKIPAGKSSMLAHKNLLPLQMTSPRAVGDYVDEDGNPRNTNQNQWLVVKFSTPVAKGEKVIFHLAASTPS